LAAEPTPSRVSWLPSRAATSLPDEPGEVGAVIRTTCLRDRSDAVAPVRTWGGVRLCLVPKYPAAQADLTESVWYLVTGLVVHSP